MDIITSPQNLTSSWVNLGSPINMASWKRLGTWLTLDINDSLNARIRAVAKIGRNDSISTPHLLPVKSASLTETKINPLYYEFETDADQAMVLEIETNGLIPYIQLQIQAGTAGATPGQLDAAVATFSNY